jgi:hypothetical protein
MLAIKSGDLEHIISEAIEIELRPDNMNRAKKVSP